MILTATMLDLPDTVPATGVGAVSLNVTVDKAAAAGFVTVFPCDTLELVSSVNFAAGQTVANAVITPVSAEGTVCFYSSAEVDLVVDVNGWFKDVSGYHAITPERLFDTRPDDSPNAVLTVDKAKLEAGARAAVRPRRHGGGRAGERGERRVDQRHRHQPRSARIPHGLPVRHARAGVERQLHDRPHGTQCRDRARLRGPARSASSASRGPTSWSTSTAGSRASERHRKRGGGCKPSYRGSVICVDIAGVGVAQPDKVLFEGLSLTISSGDRVAVVGVNGSGKSTLMRDPRRRASSPTRARCGSAEVCASPCSTRIRDFRRAPSPSYLGD